MKEPKKTNKKQKIKPSASPIDMEYSFDPKSALKTFASRQLLDALDLNKVPNSTCFRLALDYAIQHHLNHRDFLYIRNLLRGFTGTKLAPPLVSWLCLHCQLEVAPLDNKKLFLNVPDAKPYPKTFSQYYKTLGKKLDPQLAEFYEKKLAIVFGISTTTKNESKPIQFVNFREPVRLDEHTTPKPKERIYRLEGDPGWV